MKIVNRETKEAIKCRKCKNDNKWILESLHSKGYGKYTCGQCFGKNSVYVYTDPEKYYHKG